MADSGITLDIAGLQALVAKVAALEAALQQQAGTALREEAEVVMTEAKRRTPVDTGALRSSGHVTGPEFVGKDTSVVLRFGGPAAGYAIYVHENLEAHHDAPGQAKFLESAVLEALPSLPARIAARMSTK